MLFLGFSAGLPLWLIFSSLSLWLREAGIDRSVITYFSWAALGYSFKFVWAPLVDTLPLPFLTRLLGRRRSWMLFAQILVITAIIAMSSLDPASGSSLVYLAFAAVLLGFSSATQDIVIDAYRIESANLKLQALMSSTYIVGYRLGMLMAGAGVLYLASYLGSTSESYSYSAWRTSYILMAACMLIGVATTLIISEPEGSASNPSDLENEQTLNKNLQVVILFICCVAGFIATYVVSTDFISSSKTFLNELFNNKTLSSVIAEFLRLGLGIVIAYGLARALISIKIVNAVVVKTLYLEPIAEFFKRYGVSSAIVLLALVGMYRISDIVLGAISNVFYYDMGYSKNEIATVSKLFGIVMTIFGGILGGLMSFRYGVIRILLLGAILSAATNLLFMVLANTGYNPLFLYVVIGADNLSGGLASAAFVAFLSALTNIKFTAMQFAIFTSLMTLLPKILGGYSGSMVEGLGYPSFFLFTTLLGIPVVLLIIYISRDPRFNQ